MERLTSPNGVEVEACDEAVESMVAAGFKRAVAEKPKAAPKKRAAKPKEE